MSCLWWMYFQQWAHSHHMVGHWLALFGWPHATVIYLLALGPALTSESWGSNSVVWPFGDTVWLCCLLTATVVAGEPWEALGRKSCNMSLIPPPHRGTRASPYLTWPVVGGVDWLKTRTVTSLRWCVYSSIIIILIGFSILFQLLEVGLVWVTIFCTRCCVWRNYRVCVRL